MSTRTEAYKRLMNNRHDDRIQAECRLAREIQQQTSATRGEALLAAARILGNLGVVLVENKKKTFDS